MCDIRRNISWRLFAQTDIRQRFTSLNGGGDRFAYHLEEALTILGVRNTLGSDLFRGAETQKCRSQLRSLPHSLASVEVRVAREARPPGALREELQFLDLPSRAMRMVLALGHNVSSGVTRAIYHGDCFAANASRANKVACLRLRLAGMDCALQILAP